MTGITWPRINKESPLGFLLVVSFLTRIALIPFFFDGFNGWVFGAFTSLLVGGHNPYLVVTQDPTLLNINPWRYPPLYLLITVPAVLAKIATGQPLVYLAVLKIPLAICDAVSTLFLYKILATYFSKNTALRGAALFAFNPAVIFTTAVAGFTDPLAVMFTLVACYYFVRYKNGADLSERAGLYRSGLLLGLGIMAKIYPLFLVPIFLRESKNRKDRILLLASTGLPIIIFSLPFLIADPYSYLYLLTVKNAGGEHPLFGALRLPTPGELTLLGVLAIVLIWIYYVSLPIYSRLVLTFLWISIATLSNTFQYLTWGIPFFILFFYQNKSAPRLLPLYPIVAVFGALVFNGWYDMYAGTSGPFYWMFHVLQQQVVVFRAYPILGEIAAWATPISLLVSIYYFVRIGMPQRFTNLWNSLPNLRLPGRISLRPFNSTWRTMLPVLLIVLSALSWAYVASYSRFDNFSYPTLQGTDFNTSFQFQSLSLDYQLVFAGNASYFVNPAQGYIILSAAGTNTSSSIYRGWLDVRNGFHASNSALVSFRFKLEYVPATISSMNIAALSGGNLFLERKGTALDFDYFESAVNVNRTITSGDFLWHNFAINYTRQNTVVTLDNHVLALAPATLTRVILGNENDSLPFGSVEYSDFQVLLRDFPGGSTIPLFSTLSLATPSVAMVLAFALLPGGLLRSNPRKGSSLEESIPSPDTDDIPDPTRQS